MNYRISEEILTCLKEINENLRSVIVDARLTNYNLEKILTEMKETQKDG